jgi:RNA polymerase sigma-70 factor (ECF subfamily)
MIRQRNIRTKASVGSAEVISIFSEQAPSYIAATEETDAVLLEKIAEGDHVAFAVLVRRHTTRFYRIAYRLVRTANDAEDIVQIAFLKLWERPTLWQAGKNTAFTTWFYRIVTNLCLDHIKKKRPLQLINDAIIEDDREEQEQTMLQHEKQRLLDAEIASLPERQRVALNLCFYEGLSNQDAADAMGLHLKALQALLMRAKTTLKKQLRFMLEK